MSWVAIGVGLGSAVVGGVMQGRAGEKGADAQTRANQLAIEEQRRQFDLTREDQMPWLDAGRGALGRQKEFLSGDYSGFERSPDYTFARDQALQSQERGAAARGGFMGGGADADRINLASGLATQNMNNYWAKLAGQAGQGYQAAANLGQMGQNMAGNIGNSLINSGQARASSYANQANAWGNALQQGAGAFGQWYGQRGGRG